MFQFDSLLHYDVGSKTTIRVINRSWTLGYADNPDVNPKLRWSSWPHPLERGVSLLSLFSAGGRVVARRTYSVDPAALKGARFQYS